MPENLINRQATAQGLPSTPVVGDVPSYSEISLPGQGAQSVNDMFQGNVKTSNKVTEIPLSSFYIGNRYNETRPNTDYEEMAGQQQGSYDKFRNGITKMVGTAGTSFIAGTAGLLYGVGSAFKNQRMAALIDNDVTRAMDEGMERMEDALPNYYTHSETDASFLSPKNILTANFFSDKIIKNLGYSLGAIAGGVAWSSVLRAMGITNALVKAGQGLEAANTIEASMQAVPNIQKYAAFEEALGTLSQKYIKNPLSTILKDSDRILTSTMGTFGEASMEGLQGMNEYRRDAIEEYKKMYGVEPTGEALNKINESADQVGMYIWGGNSLLLTGTNYIQLPKILGSSRKADKALINEITKDAETGLYKQVVPKTTFGRIAQKAKGVSQVLFAPSEAFEEGMQFSIQTGVTNYFQRARENKQDTRDFLSTLSGAMGNVFGEGIHETLTTKEGMESILIGGISGGIQQGGIIGTYKNKEGATRVGIGKSGTIAEQGLFGTGGERQDNTKIAIDTLNKTTLQKQLKDGVKYLGIGIGSQKLRQEAIANNDVLSEKDYEADFTLSYLMPRIKYGKIDSVKEELDLYRNQAMDPEGFRELVRGGIANESETREQFIQRLNNLQELSDSVSSIYGKLNDKYENTRDENGQIKYTDDTIDKLVYAASKIKDYDKRIPELSSNLTVANINVLDIISDSISSVPTNEQLKKSISEIDFMDTTDDIKQQLKEDLIDVIELSLRRQKFIKEYNDILVKPENYNKDEEPIIADKITPELNNNTKTISIKTKSGEKEIELNTEYFLGKVTELDANGKEVYRQPRLTILGENEDGTIKIKASNGTVRDITKAELEDYKLSKVEDTLSNKKAKFFMEHQNTIYEFNFGKGNKRIGRLEYSPKDGILNFVYKNKRGEIKKLEVTGDQFKPKKGFTSPMITAVGELTTQQQEALSSYTSSEDNRAQIKNEKRLSILTDLFETTLTKQEKTTKLIEQKQKQISDIQENLKELEENIKDAKIDKRAKKAIRFKKVTREAIQTASKLSTLKRQLENEIEQLESDQEELEFTLDYISNLANSLDSLPTDSNDFLAQLRLERKLIGQAIVETGKQINSLSSLIKQVEKALESAIDFIKQALNSFEKQYPKVPSPVGQEWVDFLQSNPNFLKLQPTYREDLKQVEDLLDQIEELDVIPNQRSIDELQDNLSTLQSQLKDYEKELKAKDVILDEFKKLAAEYNNQLAQERKLQSNKALKEEFLGTMDNSVQNKITLKEDYEPAMKKAWESVIGGTVPIDDGKPHQQRANSFGFNFNKFSNKDSIKGVVVTSKNEDLLIPGLTSHLAGTSGVDVNDIIALVMVQQNPDGTIMLVNQEGQPMSTTSLDEAIYQVFPSSNLELTYDGKKETMFRNTTPDYVETSLREQYKAWRETQLSNTTLPQPQAFNPSFGIPEYITYMDDKGDIKRDWEARSSVQEAGLITNDDLVEGKVLTVATTNESITNGSTTFTTPLGRVFLSVPNGLVKLQNRKFNQKEANTIFNTILQLSKNSLQDGTVKTQSSQRLISWLKSVVYWGIAKDGQTKKRKENAGYNNIWFEDVLEGDKTVQKLFISGKGLNYTFSPTELEAHKDEIIFLLQEMYNNVNATLTNDNSWTNPYYEITSIDSKGQPVTKEWKNYQSFLLSSEGRTVDEIPLATQLKPINQQEGETNRKAIYFTLNSTIDDFVIPKEAPKPIKQAPAASLKAFKEQTPSEPTNTPVEEKQAPTTPVSNKIILDGTTQNTIPFGAFGDIQFSLNSEATSSLLKQPKFDGTQGLAQLNALSAELINKEILDLSIPGKTLQNIMNDKNMSSEQAQGLIISSLVKKLLPQVIEENIPNEPAIVDAPTTPEQVQEQEINDEDWDNMQVNAPDDKPYRLQLATEAKQFQTEDWSKSEQWLKENFPNIPVYRVKNIIQATNGKQAWGMFQNASIYIYENAEVGTVYHEVFEAVWKMFAGPKEKQKIIDEFRNRPGSYEDRFTGEKIEFSKATNAQLKEELAEEFRDFVLFQKDPIRYTSNNKISQLFQDIVKFIKEFFTGKGAPSNTQKLFDKIGDGYYADYNPYMAQLSLANVGVQDIESITPDKNAEFRVSNIPAQQLHEIVQHMTFVTLRDMTRNNESLFQDLSLKKGELYAKLKEELLGERTSIIKYKIQQYSKAIANGEVKEEDVTKKINNLKTLYREIKSQWKDIVKKHQEQLLTYGITFDENAEGHITNEDKDGKGSEYDNGLTQDNFRKSNTAIKLLLASLPNTTIEDNQPVVERSSIGGVTLIPSDRVFINLMNNLHDAVSIDDMLDKLRQMALDNPNYATLFQRLTKNAPNTPTDISQLDEHDLQLLSAFWKSMKRQNADVISVFILASGEVVISDSTLSSATKQSKREMLSSIINKIKSPNSYFTYNNLTGKYSPTKTIKDLKLNGSQLQGYISFLKALDIEFELNDIKKLKTSNEQAFNLFIKSIDGIKKSLSDLEEISTISTKTLDIDGQLSKLASIKAIIENPEFESTYFNINGERTQTFIGTNTLSTFHDVLSKAKNINDLENTPYAYILTDVFSKGSQILNKIFNIQGSGNRISNTESILKPVYVDGIINEDTGKKKQSSKLSYKERLTQEINLNLSGYYLNLVPGDASIEWAVNMHTEESPFVTEEAFLNKKYLEIFRDYFISEVNLSRDNRFVVKNKKSTDLRFFLSILGQSLNDDITSKKNQDLSPEELYEEYKTQINKAVTEYISQDAKQTEDTLRTYDIIKYGELGLETEGVNFGEVTEETLQTKLNTLSTNYMIANIELHKLLYSDPFQYADELKRIKNFNSPGQPLLHGSSALNSTLNKSYNKDYVQGDLGWTDFNKEYLNSITMEDVLSTNELQDYDDPYEEGDGGGYIMDKANRIYSIRAGEWTEDNEKQYQYDVAYEKRVKNIPLSGKELELLEGKAPSVQSTYTPKKPIVRGSKDNGRNYNDIVLHKFALVPLSFRILHQLNPNSNALKLYNKMQAEGVDYAVYATGSKVGTEKVVPLYNEDGSFSETPFQSPEEIDNPLVKQGISKIPFSIIAVQSEVPSKEVASVTTGSQITKLATLDMMENGVPIDYKESGNWNDLTEDEKLALSPLYSEIVNNQFLLEQRIEEGYTSLLKKLGIKQTKEGFILSDTNKLIDTLTEEILKREVNENITDAFEGFKSGDVVLEATPAYQQIRNILYSIADKNVVRQKISGGMKVQIPSTLLESERVAATMVNGKPVFQSDVLKFYEDEDGKRVCEIMVGRWFKSNKTDKELLDYFNNTPEGQKALQGVAFRIPTQKQNSIDVFKIAKFLPKDFKDSVVIPSALVKKVGSDFDIDKLSIYLKNIFTNGKTGALSAVPYLGTGQQAKDKFAKMFDDGELLTRQQVLQLEEQIKLGQDAEYEDKLLQSIFGDLAIFSEDDVVQEFMDELIENGVKETTVDRMYKQSLENEYIQSLENLVSHPLNFANLIKPNSAEQLKSLAKDINNKLGIKEKNYADAGNMLSRGFMSNLRQAFVTGKYAIGIAATSQTNHAQNQRAEIYIDTERLGTKLIDPTDEHYLGDGKINFKNYNKVNIKGKDYASLSGILNNAGDYISDIIGQFIDGYVDISKGPWIMELGATPNVASTWLFLIKIGVPIQDVAYFMNQPIIKDYLRTIENNGYSWLFIDKFIDEMDGIYEPKTKNLPTVTEIPNNLGSLVGKQSKDMTDVEKLQQQFLLREFLKYSKMSSHLFQVQQGSNFDTATINDPYIVFKKYLQYLKGKATIISSIDDLLNNSFVGVLKNKIFDIRDAFTTILISDRTKVRDVMENVLLPYTNLPDRDFVKLSRKAVNDLFDWAVQTNTSLNTRVASVLLGNETELSASQQIIEYRDKVLSNPKHLLYDNIILNSLKQETGNKEGKPNNLYITGRDNKVYDQNLLIGAFRELKDVLGTESSDLYEKLVRLAVLQSGLTNSPISFTTLLPYDDFKEKYNETLSDLENIPNLADFYTLHVFERNNWNDNDVVPYMKSFWRKGTGKAFNVNESFLDKKLDNSRKNKKIPKVINISMFSREGRNDFITYSWEDMIKPEEKARRRRMGDRSHIHKQLMQKVYYIDENNQRQPLIQTSEYKGKVYTNYVFKAVNAWGDSFRAQEFYSTPHVSVLDNDYVKVENEVSDDVITNILNPKLLTNQPQGLPPINRTQEKC